ncbi:MAG TPA: hypothetical protein VJS92_13835 [Candidatus Polarisedimenticolaceae bacterium]|nr:hypothetical protein [Candidatus Polarisedimenticolaceae bacterium]
MSEAAGAETCAQCATTLTPETRIASGGRVFCSACYASLRAELEQAVSAMSRDVNYAGAFLGALLGGAAGALAWWGFTAMTHIALGLIAVGIGFLVGHAVVRFSGGKRTAGLQALSVGVAVASFLVASFLVNMTLINEVLAQRGDTQRVSFPPASLEQGFTVLSAGFGVMDLVFLAIVIYEAWKIPRPLKLPPSAAA